MTERLYYQDSYLREFDGTIERVESRDGRTLVALDRSAFYPTSGGQPFDVGELGGRRVVDVFDDDDGSVFHVVEGVDRPAEGHALQVGATVHAAIDWTRRFDHMQQHTGQHVLSAAFDRLFKVRTVSFHMGAAVSTIDLAREMTPAELNAAEAEANRIVWEDRPVTVRYASAEEAAAMPLRKESVRGGTLRLVDVEGFDLSACGGTHVARSGAIGVIAVAGWERFKGGQRIEFLCGGRALDRWRLLRDTVAASVRQLSVLPEELASAIDKLQTDAKEQKRAIGSLQIDLARYQASELAAAAEPSSAGKLVLRAIDADANALKALASAIVSQPGYLVVLTSTSSPALAVVARSADVGASAQEILKGLVAQFGGRGGGKPEMAQAGGLAAAPESIFGAVRLTYRL
jgi:alanyl-tRNA synthetase